MMTPRRLAKYWLHNAIPGFAGRFPYYGVDVHFPQGAPVFRAICEQGSFEPEIIDRLVKLSRPDTTVFDVGANIGLMAIPVLRARPTCRVVSFEPSPNSLPFLERTASNSPFADRWTIVGKGVASEVGELDFTVGAPDDALFEGFRSADRLSKATRMKVPVTTLDQHWRSLDRPAVSAVKIDVEGAEGEVLTGATELLRAQHPALLVEWHAPYLDRFATASSRLLDVATTFGYQLFTVPAGVPVADRETLAVQMMGCQNFVLIPQERA